MKTDKEALVMKTQAAALVAEKLGFALGISCAFLAYQNYDSLILGFIAYVAVYYFSTRHYDKKYDEAVKMNDPELDRRGVY